MSVKLKPELSEPLLLVVLRLPKDELLLTDNVLADRLFSWPSSIAIDLWTEDRAS